MIKLVKTRCEHCHKTFLASPYRLKRGWQRYCSQKCYFEAKGLPVKRKCKVCGKTIYVRPHELKEGTHKYCSDRCMRKGRTTSIMRACKYCGKKYPVNQYKIKLGQANYCSKECRTKDNSLITLKCVICGKPFRVWPIRKRRSKKLFCSHKCRGLFYKGIKNFAWKGGISFEPYTAEFNKHIKIAIKERDKHACQECNRKMKLLAIHHIDYNKKNSAPKNLIALCLVCHTRTNHNRKYWIRRLKKKIGVIYKRLARGR
jgi:endogenous inhibitor of DNA gyrase (YacG/DUF329 family)